MLFRGPSRMFHFGHRWRPPSSPPPSPPPPAERLPDRDPRAQGAQVQSVNIGMAVHAVPRNGQDRQRLIHNLAQVAQQMQAVAEEIDPRAHVSAYDGVALIDIEAKAHNEDNTLAKALFAMPLGQGRAVMNLLMLAEPAMARHPGIIGYLKLRQQGFRTELQALRDALERSGVTR